MNRNFWKLIAGCVVVAGLMLAAQAQAGQPTVEVKVRHGQSWRGTSDGLPVLMLRGTHRERGEAHGKLAGPEIVKSCNQLASMCTTSLKRAQALKWCRSL